MLNYLLRNWIGSTVRQRAYEAARQAAFEQMGEAARDATPKQEPSTRDRPCDVGLVLALPIEAGAMEDRLQGVLATEAGGLKFRQGGLRGRNIVLVQSGVGSTAAAKATELLIAGHQPQWVISAGLAGGLQNDLSRGDFLLASEVCNEQQQGLAISLQLPAEEAGRKPRVHAGKLLSVDRIVRQPAEKQALGQTHGAMAVDMESFAVADVCRREKTRFLTVRIISDAVTDELPREIQRLARQKTPAARWGAALGAIVNRPGSLKDMLQLKEDALVFADRLAKFLEGVIVQIAPVEASSPGALRQASSAGSGVG
jgi:adenosylhomocysteine nucleosidase